MRHGRHWAILAAVGLLLAAPGCKTKKEPGSSGGAAKSSAAEGEIVAKVGEEVITLDAFQDQISHQNPLVRSRYKSQEQREKLLESLVEREAMVLEARRLGLDQDPEVQRGLKKILARHLINQEFNQKRVKAIEIGDEEIEHYYQENHDRYHAPEKVRVHHIFIAAPASDTEARKEARKKAQDLLGQIEKDSKDRRMFLKLAREHSDDAATKKVGGDTNFRSREQLEETYGKDFAQAAFSLKQANDMSGVVESDKGFYIMRLSGKQAPIDLPLEKVKGQIRTTLFARARGEAYKDFVEEVKQRVGVQLYPDVLEKVEVDDSAPSRPGRGGIMPPPHDRGFKHPGKRLKPPARLKLDRGKKAGEKEADSRPGN